jgi:hypothetical protein
MVWAHWGRLRSAVAGWRDWIKQRRLYVLLPALQTQALEHAWQMHYHWATVPDSCCFYRKREELALGCVLWDNSAPWESKGGLEHEDRPLVKVVSVPEEGQKTRQNVPSTFKLEGFGGLVAASDTMMGLFLIFFCSTGVWTQGLHLEPLHQPFFVKSFSRWIGSCKLFAWAGFKPQPSWVARVTGVSHQHPACQCLCCSSPTAYTVSSSCYQFSLLY